MRELGLARIRKRNEERGRRLSETKVEHTYGWSNRGKERGDIELYLGDAMRFIDGNGSKEAAGMQVLQELGKRRNSEPLGSDVEKLDFGLGQGGEVRKDLVCGGSVLVGTEIACFDPSGAEGRDLIVHEGDERADDEGDTVEKEGRELVAEGFAAACGEEDQARVALQDVRDHFLLLFPEFVQPKRRAQHVKHPRLHRRR